jgi:hypothetical protein
MATQRTAKTAAAPVHVAAEPTPARWEVARPQPMIDLAFAAVISGVTHGVILPGDRGK